VGAASNSIGKIVTTRIRRIMKFPFCPAGAS
jgi:hypothetical protein